MTDNMITNIEIEDLKRSVIDAASNIRLTLVDHLPADNNSLDGLVCPTCEHSILPPYWELDAIDWDNHARKVNAMTLAQVVALLRVAAQHRMSFIEIVSRCGFDIPWNATDQARGAIIVMVSLPTILLGIELDGHTHS